MAELTPVSLVAMLPNGFAVVDKLAAEITRIMQQPDLHSRVLGFGFVPEGGNADAARRFFDDEARRWSAPIKAANITIE